MFNLNFTEFVTFSYWFNMFPGPFVGLIFWLVVSKMLGGFILGIGGKVLSGYVVKDPSYKKLFNKLSALFFTQGVLLALTLFFSQTATPFLSSRFWLIIWFLILVIWFVYILKFWIFVLPKERKDRKDWQQKQKYLV